MQFCENQMEHTAKPIGLKIMNLRKALEVGKNEQVNSFSKLCAQCCLFVFFITNNAIFEFCFLSNFVFFTSPNIAAWFQMSTFEEVSA